MENEVFYEAYRHAMTLERRIADRELKSVVETLRITLSLRDTLQAMTVLRHIQQAQRLANEHYLPGAAELREGLALVRQHAVEYIANNAPLTYKKIPDALKP